MKVRTRKPAANEFRRLFISLLILIPLAKKYSANFPKSPTSVRSVGGSPEGRTMCARLFGAFPFAKKWH
jgi:hypothetical protein